MRSQRASTVLASEGSSTARQATRGGPRSPSVARSRMRWRGLVAAWLALAAASAPARATEVRCIEQSKYKYLYQLFDGDARKFAIILASTPIRAGCRMPSSVARLC